MSDAYDYLFGGGLEDDVRGMGRKLEDDVKTLGRLVDDSILQPVVSNVERLASDPKMLAAIAVNVAFPGLGAAIGSSILGTAFATAHATAAAIFGNTLLNTALNGGNIKAGLISAVGGEIGKLGAGEMAKFAKAAEYGETFGKALAAGTEGAIRSGASALIQGQDPFEAMLKGGLTAGLSTAVLTEVSTAFKDTPGLSALDSQDPLARAARAAIGAAAAGESGAKAFVQSGFGSLISLGVDYFDGLIENDQDAAMIAAGNELKGARAKLDEQFAGMPTNLADLSPLEARDMIFTPYQDRTPELQESRMQRYEAYFNSKDPYNTKKYGQYAIEISKLNYNKDVAKAYYHDIQVNFDPENKSSYQNIMQSMIDEYPDYAKRGLQQQWQNRYDIYKQLAQGRINIFNEAWDKYQRQVEKVNDLAQTTIKPLEEQYNTSLKTFEDKVGKFQEQEAVNTSLLLSTVDDVTRIKTIYKEARGQELKDEDLANYMPKITRTDISPPDPEALTRLIEERDVKRLNPYFDAEIYVKVNDLKTTNPFKDYLDRGWKEGLTASRGDLSFRIAEQKGRLLNQVADAAGLAGSAQLPVDVVQQISNSLDERNGTDLGKWQEQQLKSWDDIKGLKFVDPVMLRSNDLKIDVRGVGLVIGSEDASQGTLRQGLKTEIERAGGAGLKELGAQFSPTLRLGTAQEQLDGRGQTLTLPNGQRVFVVDDSDSPIIEGKPAGALEVVQGIQKSPLVPDSVKKSIEDILYSIQTRESNLPKVIPEFIKDAWDQTQTAQGVGIKAFGNIIQSFNGLVSLAGINPKTTPVGKFAESMIDLGKAKTSEEYRSAVEAMETNLAGAKGMAGAAKAIWQNFKNTPVEFLSEVVISEGLQEVVPLLIGGGATTFARGLALARGMGTSAAQRIGTRTGLAAAGVSDIAESAGGSAAGAFEQAYEIATKQLGKSEAEATQIALDVAARSGAFSALVTATTLGLGGAALEKAILGGSGKGAFAGALDEIGSAVKLGTKITIKEGVAEGGEEGLTTAFTEGQLYKLDPNRDVAANIASSAILGAIAGGGISGGAYGFSAGRDIVSNVLSTNPQVRQVIDNAPDAATAERDLGALGVPQQTNANLLNDRFDTEYVSSQEAYNALRSDPNFTPTEADVSQFVGKRPEADLSSEVAKYIDPKVVDEIEARAAFREIGVENPTQEEIAKYVGQNPELDTIRTIQSVIGPQATTRSEAEALFKQQGYTPTPEEIGQFTGRISDDKAKTDIGTYIAPRQVTQQEVIDELSRLGYTAKRRPTSADVTAAQDIAQGRAAYNPIYDYDGSGKVTLADVLELTKASQGRTTIQPAASTPWGADEVSQFVRTGQNVSQEDVMREVANFANPRVVTVDEVKRAAAAEGYTLSDEDARKLAGQKDEATALQQIRSTYDPLSVTAEEARAAFQAQGYTPTDEELNKYVGMKTETSTLADIASFANPRAVTRAEAEQFFSDLGYTPSQEELAQFISQADQQGVLSAVRSYVDPRQVTQAEAEKAFKDLGYTPTKDELSQFVKQGTDIQQTQVLNLLNEYVGPRQVTAEEVRAAYSVLGFPEPLDADVNKLVGQYAQSELAGKAQAALPTATYNKLTKTVTDALAGVKIPESITKKDVTDAVSAYITANPGLDSQDVADAIANYMKINPQLTKTDLSTAITTATANFATKTDIETAISGIKFPAGISKEDVSAAITDYMAKNPGLNTKDVAATIAQYMKDNPPVTKTDISSAITAATKDFATKQDITTAISGIKFPESVTKEEAEEIVLRVLRENPGITPAQVKTVVESALDALPDYATPEDVNLAVTGRVGKPSVKDDPATPENEAQPASGLYAQIEKSEQDRIATDRRIAEILGTPAVQDDPATSEDESKDATGLFKTIGGTQADLVKARDSILETLQEYEDAGIERDAALDLAFRDVVGKPAVKDDPATPQNEASPATGIYAELERTGADITREFGEDIAGLADILGTPERVDAQGKVIPATGIYARVGQAETAFTTNLQNAQDAILEQMQLYEDAGVDRDEALDLAIGKVAKDLGTTAKTLTDQITGVQQLVGRPQVEPTQADLDYLTQALQQGTTPDLTYDVTGDKKVDEQDRIALYNYIMRVPGEPPADAPAGTPGALPTFAPSLESRWAPTGIYGALARQQQELVRQEEETRKQAAAQAKAGLRQQRMGQFMNILGQAPDLLSQQVQVKAPDPARIGYIYDWSSIFSTPSQQAMFASPFAEGGTVDEDELIRYLRG